jgi:hypothetical protein
MFFLLVFLAIYYFVLTQRYLYQGLTSHSTFMFDLFASRTAGSTDTDGSA